MPADTSDVSAFAGRLDRSATSVDQTARDVGDRHGARLATAMAAAAPARTGELAASIRHVGGGVVEVGAEHGPYQEYGTARHGPQPFARPALTKVAPEYVRAAGERIVGDLTR